MEKILIIDDNEALRENTAEILQLMGFKAITANNGRTAVAIALQEKPDVILCDILMPGLDGYGVLQELRHNPATQHIPFIFLTAKSQRDDIRKGMELGADDYIVKPFTEAELLRAVESRLKKIQLLKEEYTVHEQSRRLSAEMRSSGELLRELVAGRNIERFKKKQIIFSEGNRPNCLFYLLKGKVKTYKTNDNGKELVVDLFRDGDFFGFVALLENVNYRATAVAMEETEAAIIPRDEFEELMNSSQQVNRQFIQLLARNITDIENKLVALAYNSLRKKVADALIAVHEKYNSRREDRFPIHITRDNLATIAGTAIESLIRTLGDFKDEKLIDVQNGAIVILNNLKLKNLLN